MTALRPAQRVRCAAAAATAFAPVVVAIWATDVAAAIVECVDARGVSVLTSNAEGNGCAPGTSAVSSRRVPSSKPVTVATPLGFPRVSDTTQRSRDSDRGRILRDELASEAARLAVLEASGPPRDAPSGDALSSTAPTVALTERLARTRENIRALQRELAGVR